MELKQKASSTGFRVLFLLDLLLNTPLSKDEIISKLSSNPYITNISKETVRLDLNTLKAAGFEIENTGKAQNYKYKINWSPIKIKFTKKELNVLINARNAILKLSDWEYIVNLYCLFEKISKFIKDEDEINELMDFGYFLNVDFKILKELNALTKRKKEILLLYNSPNSGKKEIAIKLKEIKYNDSKLYLTGTSKDYPDNTILRVDNVLNIIKILKESKTGKKSPQKKMQYRIHPNAKEYLNLLGEEKILKENDTFIEIEIKSDNEFSVIQRLLSFGDDLILIKDKEIKEKYTLTLKNMLKTYEEETK